MKNFNLQKNSTHLYQTLKDLVLTNKLATIIAICLSVCAIYKTGKAVGEFIYYAII